MSKQSNSKPTPFPTKAASASSGPAPIKPIRSISGPSTKGSHVGPKGAPYFQK